MNKYALQNLPARVRHKWDKIAKPFLAGRAVVNTNEITNNNGLADAVFNNYGYGVFNVLFYNLLNRNKKFNKHHRCKLKQCPYHPDYNGKHKRMHKCNKYRSYVKGKSCKNNPIFRPAWCSRMQIVIAQADNEYGYKFKVRKSKMHYFRRWFWKG